MANEVTVSSVLKMSKTISTGITIKANNGSSASIDMSGSEYDGGTQTFAAGVDELLVVKSDFGTPKYLWMKNIDATNYIEVGNWNSGTQIYFAKLAAGEQMVLPITVAKGAIACLANTGTITVEWLLIEA